MYYISDEQINEKCRPNYAKNILSLLFQRKRYHDNPVMQTQEDSCKYPGTGMYRRWDTQRIQNKVLWK